MERLKLQMALTSPLIATKGYVAPEVEQACGRAVDLCQQIGDSPYLFGVLGGLNSIYFNRCELDVALALAKRMLERAEMTRDRISLLWAHYALGFTLASQGKFRSARNHLERSVAFYDKRKSGTYGYVQDPGPTAMAMLARLVHLLGYPDQAMRWLQQSLALAEKVAHPFTSAWVLGFSLVALGIMAATVVIPLTRTPAMGWMETRSVHGF
jgi:tetratricopeptide (TPR) repeat protein